MLRNSLANVVGRFITAGVGFLLIPLYIRLMGTETYALVAITILFGSMVSLLDMGFGAALIREASRAPITDQGRAQVRSLLMSLEVLYWMAGFVAALLVAGLSLPIAAHWFKQPGIPVRQLAAAIATMGLVTAPLLPNGLYSAGLMGLQRQVLLNSATAFTCVVRHLVTLLGLVVFARTIETFLVGQLVGNVLQVSILRRALWRQLGTHARNWHVGFQALRGIRHFAVGTGLGGIVWVILSQADKVIVSGFLPLRDFTYYSIAGTAASLCTILAACFTSAMFPRLSELSSPARRHTQIKYYHGGCQLISVVVIPMGLLLAIFPQDLLFLWTKSQDIANNAAPCLRLLAMSSALLALAAGPYALQLAHGWSRLSLYLNLALASIVVPVSIVATQRLGAQGAALAWLIPSAGYLLIGVPLMHRYLYQGEIRQWCVSDVLTPVLVSSCAMGLVRVLMLPAMRFHSTGLVLAMAYTVGVATAMASAPQARELLRDATITLNSASQESD